MRNKLNKIRRGLIKLEPKSIIVNRFDTQIFFCYGNEFFALDGGFQFRVGFELFGAFLLAAFND